MSAYKIDKSLFDDQDLKDWERLVAKGMVQVDPAAGTDTLEDNPSAAPAVEKAAPPAFEMPAFVTDAIAKSNAFIEEQEKKEQVELAKKYDILGLKPEEIGKELYELKKSNEAAYNTVIKTLDGQLALIEKSPMFAEIGKSGHSGGSYNGLQGAEAKVHAKAQEIQKSCPDMTYDACVAKAWEDPDLAAEYDAEYFSR